MARVRRSHVGGRWSSLEARLVAVEATADGGLVLRTVTRSVLAGGVPGPEVALDVHLTASEVDQVQTTLEGRTRPPRGRGFSHPPKD